MAKKKVSKKKKTTIDNIPMCSQQRRSSPQKRRTDFSLFFFCNSSSSSNSGSLLESSCVKLALINKMSNSLHVGGSVGKQLFPSSLVRCSSKSMDEGPEELSSNSSEALILEVELVNQNFQLESHSDRRADKLASENLGVLDYTPKKSHVSKTLCVSPESVTSDKACEWLPDADLSQMSCGELVKNSNAASDSSDEQDLSSDKSTLSVSSRIDDDSIERGRGKRERKPKVHFDDINIAMPLKPDKQVRRLRIMRYLGLTPPIGSPF